MAGKSADLMVKAFRAIRKSRPFYFIANQLTIKDGAPGFLKGENNMVKVKAGGIVLGGLAAYLIISKGMNVVGGAVRNICESRKWKNYYKYGKEGNMVPPGYSMHTHENENGDTVEVNDGKQPVKQPQEAGKTSTGEALGRAVSDAILKMINDTFGTPKEAEGASEGDLEASEKLKQCPHDCFNCKVSDEDCLYIHLRPNHGVITEWSKDGEPIAGAYAYNRDKDAEWKLYDSVRDNEKQAQSTDDNIVQLHVDDILVNGKDPGDPDGLNRKDGDYDGDIPDDDRLKSDPEIIKMAEEATKKMNVLVDKAKEDYKP